MPVGRPVLNINYKLSNRIVNMKTDRMIAIVLIITVTAEMEKKSQNLGERERARKDVPCLLPK